MEKQNLPEEKKQNKKVPNERFMKKLKTFLLAVLFFGCIIACLFFTKNMFLLITIALILAVIITFISKD